MSGDVRGASEETEAQTRSFLAGHVIFIRYIFFNVLAGLANLGSQQLTLQAISALPVMASVLVGTAVGFLVKYALEKKWVFLDEYDGHAAEIRKIAVYGAFSVGTTMIFWAFELGAWRLWQTSAAKYFGAVVGLSIGNLIKYLLDKHFVFGRKP